MKTVTVIGGGVSGSLVANLLAKNDIETVLIEKNSKIGLEHHTSLNAIDNWYRKDLMKLLKMKIPAKAIYNSIWHSPYGNEFNLKFSRKPLFYIIKRGNRNNSINRILLEGAQKNGCKIYKNCREIKIKRNKNSFKIICSTNNVKKNINSNIIIDASRYSKRNKILKKDLGVVFGSEIFFKKCIDTSTVEVFFDENFFPGGYMYVLPENENKATVGATMRPHLMKNGLSSKYYFLESMKKNKYISEKFRDSKVISTFSGIGDLSGPKEKLENKNILYIGDSANFMEPLFGFGVRNALLSAKFCSESIMKSNEIENIGNLYEETCKKELFPVLKKQKFLRRIYDKLNNSDIELLFSIFEDFSKKVDVESFIEKPGFSTSLLRILIPKSPKLISLLIK